MKDAAGRSVKDIAGFTRLLHSDLPVISFARMKSYLRRFCRVFLLALICCSACSRHHKTAAEAAFDAGINQCQSGDYAGAITSFNKSIELNPKNPDAYLNRGIAKSYLKDY